MTPPPDQPWECPRSPAGGPRPPRPRRQGPEAPEGTTVQCTAPSRHGGPPHAVPLEERGVTRPSRTPASWVSRTSVRTTLGVVVLISPTCPMPGSRPALTAGALSAPAGGLAAVKGMTAPEEAASPGRRYLAGGLWCAPIGGLSAAGRWTAALCCAAVCLRAALAGCGLIVGCSRTGAEAPTGVRGALKVPRP